MISTLRTKIKMVWLQLVNQRNESSMAKLAYNGRLSEKLWDLEVGGNDHLRVGDLDVAELAVKYGTPLHIIDKKRLKKNYTRFYNAFADHYPFVEIGYSYKTNPLPGTLKILHDCGACAEVISHFELWLALQLGVLPSKIIFNGPAKTKQALDLAIEHKIKIINIDSFSEIDVINECAVKHCVQQKVGVRVISSVGWASQFGLSIANGNALEAFKRLAKLDNVVPCGLHIHLGTGIRNINIYQKAIREILEFAILIQNRLGVEIEYFDLGGGFGVPTVREYSMLDTKLLMNGFPALMHKENQCPPIEEYGKTVVDMFRHYYPGNSTVKQTLLFEPGRAISSSAQFLLLKVIGIKPGENGVTNIILDGGKNITMPLNYEFHEAFSATKMTQSLQDRYYNVFGPLCHPNDILFRARKFPNLEIGDLIAVMDAGAYFIPNQMNFSNPRPAAVVVENGVSKLIRERETFENIIVLDNVL